MQRVCLPELLDSLAPDDPAALSNRRDLRLINRFMGNPGWFARTLPRLVRPGEAILELGAGTGELSRLLHRQGLPVDGLDLWPAPASWPQERAWHRADLRQFEGFGAYPVVMGNLILHQFQDAELAALGSVLRKRARVIVASEPERRRSSQIATALIAPLFGAHPVTLHDAHVSVTGGFKADELARLLGLSPGDWQVRSSTTLTGANRMIAERRP